MAALLAAAAVVDRARVAAADRITSASRRAADQRAVIDERAARRRAVVDARLAEVDSGERAAVADAMRCAGVAAAAVIEHARAAGEARFGARQVADLLVRGEGEVRAWLDAVAGQRADSPDGAADAGARRGGGAGEVEEWESGPGR